MLSPLCFIVGTEQSLNGAWSPAGVKHGVQSWIHWTIHQSHFLWSESPLAAFDKIEVRLGSVWASNIVAG